MYKQFDENTCVLYSSDKPGETISKEKAKSLKWNYFLVWKHYVSFKSALYV